MKKSFKSNRVNPKLSAESMADIAFLLLIFFLVTTTIVQDKGILVRLPQWVNEPVVQELNEKNVLSILVNKDNKILVEDRISNLSELKDHVIRFITNPSRRKDLPESPDKAIISILNDRDADYHTYVNVYNEIKAAYNQIWEAEAQDLYQSSFKNLSPEKRKAIRTIYPQIISEAEE